jgi:predicted transcriptional regulator
MKKRTFSLSENQIAALQAIAKKTGLVISEHVRRAIDAYLERQKAAQKRR